MVVVFALNVVHFGDVVPGSVSEHHVGIQEYCRPIMLEYKNTVDHASAGSKSPEVIRVIKHVEPDGLSEGVSVG